MPRRFLPPLLVLFAAGCGAELPSAATEPEPAPSAVGTKFDSAKAGTLTGRVVWRGKLPDVPQPDGADPWQPRENPNEPDIDPNTNAVRGAVVFLRGVDPASSRPWDHPLVRVEIGRGAITVVQGERRGRVGFVRRGDAFTATSTDPDPQLLRGRGDAFFGLPFPDPNSPTTRTLTTAGRVELSSGTGVYWSRADLFVSDHPYFTVTGPDGGFKLDRVPAGKVEVVAWLPGWGIARKERDAETTLFVRMWYTPPVESAAAVVVEPARTAEAQLALP